MNERPPPVSEETIYESKRHASTIRVTFETWQDGRSTVSIALMGLRADTPRWKIITLQAHEVAPVAEALLSVLKEPE